WSRIREITGASLTCATGVIEVWLGMAAMRGGSFENDRAAIKKRAATISDRNSGQQRMVYYRETEVGGQSAHKLRRTLNQHRFDISALSCFLTGARSRNICTILICPDAELLSALVHNGF